MKPALRTTPKRDVVVGAVIPAGRPSVKELAIEAMKLANQRAATTAAPPSGEQKKPAVNGIARRCEDLVAKLNLGLREAGGKGAVEGDAKPGGVPEEVETAGVPDGSGAARPGVVESVSSRQASPLCAETPRTVSEATRNWLNNHPPYDRPVPLTRYLSITSVQPDSPGPGRRAGPPDPARQIGRYLPRVTSEAIRANALQFKTRPPGGVGGKGGASNGFVAGFLPYDGRAADQRDAVGPWSGGKPHTPNPNRRFIANGDARFSPADCRLSPSEKRIASLQRGATVTSPEPRGDVDAPPGANSGNQSGPALAAIKEEFAIARRADGSVMQNGGARY